MARPRLCLLGGFDLTADEEAVPGISRKARALMAYLALQTGHSQSREKLAGLLWGGNGEPQARMNLRQTLSAIRRIHSANSKLVLTDADNIALNFVDIDLDVAQFETLAASSEPEHMEKAAALYRGDLLDGFSVREEPFEDWLRVERERLRAISIRVLERLVAHYSATNNLASCVRTATRLLSSEPLREDIHRVLMRAYAGQGHFNRALKQYELCRDALQRQLQLQPEQETRALYQQLRTRRSKSAAGATAESAATARTAAEDGEYPNSRLPRPHTHYVKSSGASIAYQVTGNGPFDMVYVQAWVSNLDYAWPSPKLAHVLQRLGTFCRLIRIDKRGTGLSDRSAGLATLEERMEDVRAVLDASRPTRAIHCAIAIRERMKSLGLLARVAVHVGECEIQGKNISGMAIKLTARLLGNAGPGEIISSRTVRDLALGSNLIFDERGEVELETFQEPGSSSPSLSTPTER